MATLLGAIEPELKSGDSADQPEHQTIVLSKNVDEHGDTNKHNDKQQCKEVQYGWGPWKPQWLQCFNNPKGYLLLLSFQGFMQGMVAFGYLYVAVTTLEKRFNLSSVSTGLIASCYDIAGMTVIIFVTYFGERSNKPAWVGCGGMTFATGAILFSLPHFLTGVYDYEVTEFDTCDTNRTISDECDPSVDNSSLSTYIYVFMVGNLLMGLGGAPLYTLGVTYMDDNLKPEDFGLHMGIFNAACGIGPAIGYLVGGLFLNIFTDIRVDKNDLTISPESPLWVGAWWLGFVVFGSILLPTSMAFFGFPSKASRAKHIAKYRKSEEQSGSEFTVRKGIGNNVRDFPTRLWKMIKNAPFMMLTGLAITEWFILSGIAVFTPKYLESQFNMTVVTAALYTGIGTLISGVGGSLLGGWMIKRFKLSCIGQLKLCLTLICISLLPIFCFLMYCDNIRMAGITVQYDNSSVPIGRGEKSDLTAACNADCNCEPMFDPVCGVNNVLYYSACHAGCHEEIESAGITQYANCTCVMTSGISLGNVTIHAEDGRCEQRCHWQWIFVLLNVFLLTIMFTVVVPAWTATMRCVPYDQRAFGLGIQTVLYGLLGTIPGPIVYGTFIDVSCLIWEYQCDGAASCWFYDNKLFAHSFLLITVIVKIFSILFCVGSVVFYKPVEEDDHETVE